jgi:predicted nucleic acid-binding protein
VTRARHVVLDASVLLRRVHRRSSEADAVIRRDRLAAPALIAAETANALLTEVRFADLELDRAAALLQEALDLPIDLVPDAELAAEALAIGAALGLSVYDALYVALAERLHAPLVTADTGLAERYPRSELIP